MAETPLPKPAFLRIAAIFAVAILLGLAALIPLLASDKAARLRLETTAETTAVGDQNFLQHRTRGPAPTYTLHGKLLVPPSPRHIEIRDSRMTFAGYVDGESKLRLYTANDPVPWEKGEFEQKGQPVYYLKVEPGEYLRVQ